MTGAVTSTVATTATTEATGITAVITAATTAAIIALTIVAATTAIVIRTPGGCRWSTPTCTSNAICTGAMTCVATTATPSAVADCSASSLFQDIYFYISHLGVQTLFSYGRLN